MATLSKVCDQLKETLEAIGFRVYEYEPDEPNPPCVVIEVGDSEQVTFQRGDVVYNLELGVYVFSVSDRASQVGLRSYLSWTGPNSLANTLFAAPTFRTDPAENVSGTPTMTGSVKGFRGYDPRRQVGLAAYAYATVLVEVHTRGDG